jgi:hypothetical protein
MRLARVRRLSPLLLLLFVCGCASHNKGKIEGTKWSSQPCTIKGQSLSANAFELQFGADGSLVYKGPAGTFNGTYSCGMLDYVSFHLSQPLPGNGKTDVTETIRISGNSLTMSDLDGTTITFTRAN